MSRQRHSIGHVNCPLLGARSRRARSGKMRLCRRDGTTSVTWPVTPCPRTKGGTGFLLTRLVARIVSRRRTSNDAKTECAENNDRAHAFSWESHKGTAPDHGSFQSPRQKATPVRSINCWLPLKTFFSRFNINLPIGAHIFLLVRRCTPKSAICLGQRNERARNFERLPNGRRRL